MTPDPLLARLGDRVKLRRELPDPAACRALRRALDVSAEELGEACGVGAEAILAWERGDRRPRGRNRDRYARALRVLGSAAPTQHIHVGGHDVLVFDQDAIGDDDEEFDNAFVALREAFPTQFLFFVSGGRLVGDALSAEEAEEGLREIMKHKEA